ncbi:ABC transporter substrate-binding protein [Metasolibacillus meyeri]|uniref:ABC transporter substrate-binding protein n=1 Tax=Metasolibacillus meyeri TaxID=1071052 RepID=A0AAW9NTY1_9BACL|nr:ABC transporter substrate-binding protein [Metasolibacillus meyeri]MEC1177985.1 ABC transporter substrate-binding protein [Metasolibacillus meyeri]
MKKKILLGIGLATMLLLAACGNSSDKKTEEAASESHYPLTVENFAKAEGGSEWTTKEQVFDKAPERIMANTRPAAELLLHLGLGDRIVGVSADFGAPDPTVADDYAKLTIISDGYVGKEVTLGTNPDLVYGRGGLFDNADWGVGTVDSLNEMGIKTYVLESSVTGGTYASIYKDIENLGNIFSVQDKAQSFIDVLKAKEDAIAKSLESITENKTFAYLHTNDPKELYVWSAHGESFFHAAFNMVKLDNVFKDITGDVSLETLISTDPDVLILPNFDGSDLSHVRDAIYENPKLSSMKAIKNKAIYIVDYNYLFGYGYNTIDGMELLAKEMYPELFK